jgi:hypothetical protein
MSEREPVCDGCPRELDLMAALKEAEAKVAQWERESADENTCRTHPKTMLAYVCAACHDALTGALRGDKALCPNCQRELRLDASGEIILHYCPKKKRKRSPR